MTNDQFPIPNPQSPIPKRALRFLGRIDVAVALILVLLLLALLGSCFPQISPAVAADPERLSQWEAGARARYGKLADLLFAASVFRWFRSPVFLVSLALLAIATFACTLDRWRGIWRRAFYRPVRCSDAAFDHAPHTAALLSAGPAVGVVEVVRRALRQRGFKVRTTEGITGDGRHVYLRGDRNRLTPLATIVTHLAVVLLLLGAALSAAFGWREEITVGPDETIQIGHGSGLALRNDEFAIQRYPDGTVAGYEAHVAVVAEGREPVPGTIRLNEPLRYQDVGLLLQAYQETADGTSVTLLALRDPGYGLVIAAGFLLLVGMTVSFNFPHCCVRASVEPEGALRLAGRADRRACDFGREFAALVEEIERTIISQEGHSDGTQSPL